MPYGQAYRGEFQQLAQLASPSDWAKSNAWPAASFNERGEQLAPADLRLGLRCLPENAALAIVKGLKENDQQIKHLEFIELEAQAAECGNVLSELIGYKSLLVFLVHSNVELAGQLRHKP